MAEFEIHCGNAQTELAEFRDKVFDCAVTSPPYYKLRDYKHPDQIGQESSPSKFVERLADVFDEVKRVLKDTGSLWINIDDVYVKGCLLGVPWMLAFELVRRGWCLRGDAIWFKTNGTPSGAKNRLTRTHEYLFHFTKENTGYYFDMDSIREPHTNPWVLDCLAKFSANPTSKPRINLFNKEERHRKGQKGVSRAEYGALLNPNGKNKRGMLLPRFYRLRSDLTTEQVRHVLAELSK